MLALSLVFPAVLVVPVLGETFSPGRRTAFALTDTVIWMATARVRATAGRSRCRVRTGAVTA
jgi:hypothetical protein